MENSASFKIRLTGLRFKLNPKVYFTNSKGRIVANGVLFLSTVTDLLVEFTNSEAGYLNLNVLFEDKYFGYFETASN